MFSGRMYRDVIAPGKLTHFDRRGTRQYALA